jgi:hypothetical protein
MGRSTPIEVRTAYLQLRRNGFSQAAAMRETGIKSSQTAHKFDQALPSGVTTKALAAGTLIPPPKSWDELGPEPRRALEDFEFFSARYMCRRPVPWRLKAAALTIEMLLADEKSFAVANIFPGSGKSTLWTLDIPAWLLCGGGFLDPARGRALRMILGHEALEEARQYIGALQRMLTLEAGYYDRASNRRAEGVLARDFGRFRGVGAEGDPVQWRRDSFFVAQVGDLDVYEREPTVSTGARNSAILSNRANYVAFDDLVTGRTTRDENLPSWFEREVESRVEPGGCLWLVGARDAPHDLFGDRLEQKWVDDDGVEHKRYVHISWPAHNEATCDSNHRQWDLEADGCLLDEARLPYKEIEKLRGRPGWETTYQQAPEEDAGGLVESAWIYGGKDSLGYGAPGCLDAKRGFREPITDPDGAPRTDLIHYIACDPAQSTGYWAFEHWAVTPDGQVRYLIDGARAAVGPKEILKLENNVYTGILQDMFQSAPGCKILAIEENSALMFLRSDLFEMWRWSRGITVFNWRTDRNKNHEVTGVAARLVPAYRDGRVRLPYNGAEVRSYIREKIRELTLWPHTRTSDTVMAEWVGAASLDKIIATVRTGRVGGVITLNLPRERHLNVPQSEADREVAERDLPPWMRSPDTVDGQPVQQHHFQHVPDYEIERSAGVAVPLSEEQRRGGGT